VIKRRKSRPQNTRDNASYIGEKMDEQKPKTIGEMSTEELALELGRQYQVWHQAHLNIIQIGAEIEQRKARHDSVEKETT
jgi:hypothetical protein